MGIPDRPSRLHLLRSPLARAAAAAVLLASLIAAGVVVGVIVPLKRDADLQLLDAEAHGIARTFARLTPPTPRFEAMGQVLVEDLLAESRVTGIATYEPDGTPMLRLGADPPTLAPGVAAALAAAPVLAVPSGDGRSRDLAWLMPYSNAPDRQFVMAARADVRGLQADLAAFTLRAVALTAGFGLLLTAGLLLFLNWRIIGPVLRLGDAMRTAAEDPATPDRHVLPPGRADEIGAMTASFNAMIRRIGATVASLHDAQADLLAAKTAAETALADLKQTQASLVEAEKMAALGSLVAGVAHEINTPIGNALGAATHLARRTRESVALFGSGKLKKSDAEAYFATAQESTGIMAANLGRAGDLIKSFKQVAVDQTSDMKRRFDLAGYLGEMLLSLKPRLKQTSHSVAVDCPDGIDCDTFPGALSQVVGNLVINALVHAFEDREGGEIRITGAARGSDGIEVTVADNGRGIPPEIVGRIFDPFFTTKRGAGGTGLGLNIVYNLVVQRLGGTITVDSTLGRGTIFMIRLPRVAAVGAEPQPADTRFQPPSERSPA